MKLHYLTCLAGGFLFLSSLLSAYSPMASQSEINFNLTIGPIASDRSDERKDSRSFLLRDEGLSQLSYVNLVNPQSNWHQQVPKGRDLQLVGNGRVLIGTESGYEERLISNGEKVFELTSFPGAITARRLRNGKTLLAGANWRDSQGIVLVITDSLGNIDRKIVFSDFQYVRLIRETMKGTFLITSNNTIFEGDSDGKILWEANVEGRDNPHAWQAVRLKNGNTVLSSGYGGSIQIFDKKGNLIKKISGPDRVKPNFYSGMQILPNGNMVIANWQGHGPDHGTSGTQLLEYSPDGELVWSWQQDPAHFSSLQGVIILDGLDLNQLHVEDKSGVLSPVKK